MLHQPSLILGNPYGHFNEISVGKLDVFRASIDARWKVISLRAAKRHIVNSIVSPEHAIWDLSDAIVSASKRSRAASAPVQKTRESDRSVQFARIARLIRGSDSG